jgi:hypothetical protein
LAEVLPAVMKVDGALPTPAAISSMVRPEAIEVRFSVSNSSLAPGCSAPSVALNSSQLVRLPPERSFFSFTRCQAPFSRSPSKRAYRCPCFSPSSMGFFGSGSQ